MDAMGDLNLKDLDLDSLRIIRYPDPRLAQAAKPVARIDDKVRRLAQRMFELMEQAKGVGLAATQVGLPIQLFVANPSGQPGDRRVYVNPQLVSLDGKIEVEEGCLSVPGITCKLKRYQTVTIQATGLDGKEFEETGVDLAARVYQHETDHLNGMLILDRMGSVARLANRWAIRQLEEEFEGK